VNDPRNEMMYSFVEARCAIPTIFFNIGKTVDAYYMRKLKAMYTGIA
jgi:hypothetical protein